MRAQEFVIEKKIGTTQYGNLTIDIDDHAMDYTSQRTATPKQVSGEPLQELSFLGSQCTKDCSGHRAGYAWYKRRKLTPQSRSPSFNKGAALAAQGL